MFILGISAYYHDSACALVKDGEIIAAAQEERFTRKKHDSRFPHYAMSYCLCEAGITLDDIDYVVFYEKPFLKFERLLETYVAFAPKGLKSFWSSMPLWLRDKLFLKRKIIDEISLHGEKDNLEDITLFSEHHLSHAASAFFPSPYDEAAILTMDGVGEWTTTSIAKGSGRNIDILKTINFPHSLGLLYSAFTYYLGFKVNSGEYKLMGLAPYGNPSYAQIILDNLVDVKDDGSFRLNMDYFDYCTGFTMTNRAFNKLFDGPVRREDESLSSRHMDIAASIQAVTEDIILRITRYIAKQTRLKNLCLAGGVALNCTANGKVLREGLFKNIWIQPASGDAGGALGAALAAYYLHLCNERPQLKGTGGDCMKGAYLGPAFTQEEIEDCLRSLGAVYDVFDEETLLNACVSDLVEEKAVGLFYGRMEYGSRALGARSILADPRSTTMQKRLNLKIKYRESFRPFAPSVLMEDAHEWFDLRCDSPYMTLCAGVAGDKRRILTDGERNISGIGKLSIARSLIPAVTHVDYSARIQTVHEETNPRFFRLISLFKAKTGCPVVLNTSFNVRGEPIVCTPKDAFRCFMGTDMDSLAIGNCYLHKSKQKTGFRNNYNKLFEPD